VFVISKLPHYETLDKTNLIVIHIDITINKRQVTSSQVFLYPIQFESQKKKIKGFGSQSKQILFEITLHDTFPWLLFSGAVVCDDLHRIIALTRFNEENKV